MPSPGSSTFGAIEANVSRNVPTNSAASFRDNGMDPREGFPG